MFEVTLRRVRLTVVAVEKQTLNIFEGASVCHSYPACKSLFFLCPALYCHLCPVRLYHIFPHCVINGTIFGGGGIIEHKMCFFSTSFV